MPKEKKKITARALIGQSTRHAPLGQVIQDDIDRNKYAAPKGRGGPKGRRGAGSDDENELLDEKTSKRILELSREQQLEIDSEARKEQRRIQREGSGGMLLKKAKGGEADSSDEEREDDDSVLMGGVDDDALVAHDDGYVTIVEGAQGLSAEEEKIVASMMGGNGEERQTLADIIMAKIDEKETQAHGDDGVDEDDGFTDMPPKVVEVYTDIGKILSRYTAGKLPKAFKVIPSLSNWEEVLYLTRPDLWTPQAMYAATRIFASNLNPKMAQRFYNLVLLDAVRADIFANKKLNYHYYMALKKSVYKPAAFFKGILLPLCKENCTLREAAIVGSVLQRVSIPVHHSAVAIHKLAQLEYSGASSIFIKTLLNKKYSLPAPVIGSLVRHFAAFIDDDRVLPVLWHQCLLVFVQRYKNEVKNEARESLRIVMKKHFHPKITPEIRRELFGAQAWKEERTAAGVGAMDM
eukprot:CAMPEP_0197437420 /NCGR_PEP_ID=MMETSP1175-20131217/4673_1 /TAXON_ID=1003142 /ORGANISM="Triceratium dubium, Strain CCMP147" /LENGTH=463 /DNA_ID=CAMNT_0042966941 /DNA_START=73 /DNA_END=1464 /DNA_ORIENTATION=+